MSDWRELAKCQGMDPLVFYPENEERKGRRVDRARAICAECPVRLRCLNEGIRNDEPGIWGGMTREERRCRNVWKTGVA